MNWVEESNLAFCLMGSQERAGCRFDIPMAKVYWDVLQRKKARIEAKVEPHLPEKATPKSKIITLPKVQFKKDGTLHQRVINRFAPEDIRGDVGNYEVRYPDGSWRSLPCDAPLNATSKMGLADKELKDYLMKSHGWKPTIWNRSPKTGELTSPKFHENGNLCSGLENIQWEYIDDVIKYLSYRHRSNMLYSPKEKGDTGLIVSAYKGGGYARQGMSNLTNTHRLCHRGVVNIPAVRSLFGRFMRSLFIAREGNVLVGYDASGLEARIMAHFTHPYDNGEFARIMMEDLDWHTMNAEVWGVTRPLAKNGAYAVIYGARPPKLASTLQKSREEGQYLFDTFWETNIGLGRYRDNLLKQWKNNGKRTIIGLDGRPIHTRSEHSVVNAAFQSAGAVVMELAGNLMYRWADSVDIDHGIYYFKGKPARRVIFSHDEYLWDCDPDIAQYVSELGVKSIVTAGEMLNLNVGLDAEAKIGYNYAQVH